MAKTLIRPLWNSYGRECLLFRVEGFYELHLWDKGRTMRLETCRDEQDAVRKAAEWLTATAAQHQQQN